MRITCFVFALFFGQVIIGYSQAPYQIKSCKIDYIFSNGLQKGTKILIFSDSGKLAKEIGASYVDTSAKIDLPKELVSNRTTYNQLIIQTMDSVFSVDLDLQTGYKRATIFFFNEKTKDSIFGSMSKKVRQDTLLGRKCDIFDMNGAKLWYWKGIILKKELLPNQLYEYATSIDENYIIKPDEFDVPKNIKMQ